MVNNVNIWLLMGQWDNNGIMIIGGWLIMVNNME